MWKVFFAEIGDVFESEENIENLCTIFLQLPAFRVDLRVITQNIIPFQSDRGFFYLCFPFQFLERNIVLYIPVGFNYRYNINIITIFNTYSILY